MVKQLLKITWRQFCFVLYVLPLTLLVLSCSVNLPEHLVSVDENPKIQPSVSGITIPPNIAPLNFKINEEGKWYWAEVFGSLGDKILLKSSNGIIQFPQKAWKKLLSENKGNKISIQVIVENQNGEAKKFKPFDLFVANESIDPYLFYRLLFPGYEGWYKISIVQRNLTNFEESSMVENQLIEHNCVNCHSFCQNDPDKFMLHVRGNKGGTYFVDGEKITKTNLKTKEMDFGAVYPYWHPGGRFVAYSSNKVVQNFYADPHKNIEVYDLASSLVIYDTEKNEMLPIGGNDTAKYMETFPTWSPDGKYIYFCVADQVSEGFDVEDVKYSLARRSFDAGLRSFGEMEMVYDAKAIGKSVSFPRISPNGKNLVFTLFDFGTFSIWHKEADLYNLDLTTKEASKMSVNSDETESYHSWSSNGRWLVFSSKRGDGLSARPYIAYVREDGTFGKPFIMPQKDPAFYDRMLKTYNVPEFVTGEIKIGPREIARTANDKPLNASWAGN